MKKIQSSHARIIMFNFLMMQCYTTLHPPYLDSSSHFPQYLAISFKESSWCLGVRLIDPRASKDFLFDFPSQLRGNHGRRFGNSYMDL